MNRREFSSSIMLAVPAIAAFRHQFQSQLLVNGARLNAHLAELAQIGKTPEGGTHRVAYSDADLQARQYAMKLMREAKLEVVVDVAGNIIGSRAGLEPLL